MRKSLALTLALIIFLTIFSNSNALIIAEQADTETDLEENVVEELSKEEDKEQDSLGIHGKSAVVIDGNTTQLIYGKNENEKMYPASTTKIMTGILVIENGKLDDTVTITQDVIDATKGNSIDPVIGEEFTVDDLLKIMMIGSANDAAYALAKHIGDGSVDEFVTMMNKKAQELGAINSNFTNPSGLHDDDHYTTAYDMALIAKYAMDDEYFRSIVSEYIYEVQPTNENEEIRFLKSNNRLLYSELPIEVDGNLTTTKYPGTTGVKTGFTQKAGSCLVSSVEDESSNLIGVVFSSDWDNIFLDSHKLYNFVYKNYDNKLLGTANEFVKNFPVKKGSPPFVTGVLKNDFSLHLDKNFSDNVVTDIIPDEKLEAPIKKGQKIGEVVYKNGDKIVAAMDLIAGENVEVDPASRLHRKILSKWYWFIFIFMIANRFYKLQRRKRRRK